MASCTWLQRDVLFSKKFWLHSPEKAAATAVELVWLMLPAANGRVTPMHSCRSDTDQIKFLRLQTKGMQSVCMLI
jgi:hypothetical protein